MYTEEQRLAAVRARRSRRFRLIATWGSLIAAERAAGKTWEEIGRSIPVGRLSRSQGGLQWSGISGVTAQRWHREWISEHQVPVSRQTVAVNLRKTGMSYGRIAQVMGVSRSTVQTWVRRSESGCRSQGLTRSSERLDTRPHPEIPSEAVRPSDQTSGGATHD